MQLNDCLHIHLDFETYSKAPLPMIGVYKYAEHPTTDVLLASCAVGDGPVYRWRPGDPYPFEVVHDRLGDDAFILAWNSNFERIIWQQVMCRIYGWPMPPLEAFVCVAAWARDTAASPSKLELAGIFFDQNTKKDMKGHRLMMQMCKPATESQQLKWLQKDGREMFRRGCIEEVVQFAADRCHHTPENREGLHSYCDLDVEVERGIAEILPEWDWPEIEQFWESERINDRGLCVDVDFASAAADFADEEKTELALDLAEVTDNEVTTPRQFARFQKWALPRMSKEATKLTEWYDNDVKKYTFDADTRATLLAAAEEDPEFLSDEVFEAISILDEAGKSTISKYISIRNRATRIYTDGRDRVHGAYMFAGGAQTGRYSSHGTQMHNLVRDVPKDAPAQIAAFIERDDKRIRLFGKPIHTLGKLVRPTITGDPGDEFDLVWGDWSSIEAIALPWLSLDPDADDVLAVFRRGEDIYIRTAAAILSKPVGQITKDERQSHGKVPVLSLGYLGGAGAFKAMAKNYGVRLDDEMIGRIVKNWRAANPWAMRFGDACEAAAQTAMEHAGRDYSAGRVSYRYEPDALGGMGALFCTLPSGRRICYPDPKIEIVEKAWGDTLCVTCRKGGWRPAKGSNEWPRIAVWKGLMVENVTQATCADLLRIKIADAPLHKLVIAGHTHDEILAESRYPEEDAPKLKALMEARPGWPGDDALPLKAETGWGYRYKVDLSKEG
jgi:DNA polymerase